MKLFKMSDKVYDVLKWIALILIPAIGTLYFALAGIWGFPYAEAIVGTLTAVDTFLGAILGISTSMYKKNQNESNDFNEEDESGLNKDG